MQSRPFLATRERPNGPVHEFLGLGPDGTRMVGWPRNAPSMGSMIHLYEPDVAEWFHLANYI